MSDLYSRIDDLCAKENVSITDLCRDAGISRGSLTDLKMGRIAELSTKTLWKISNYFRVSIDSLLGKEEENAPILKDERDTGFDDFTYAMYEEGKGLTEENKRKLLEMAKFFKQQQEQEK
jgi:transcriptional regulator with XRE-family HTH domain